MRAAIILLALSLAECSYAFQIPYSSSVSITQQSQNNRITLFAKDEGTLFFAEGTDTTTTQQSAEVPSEESNNQLFDSGTLAEANDALSNVGWSGVAPIQGDGEMTSDDPFVKQIDESIRGEIGVGLDELLNPAKVSCSDLLHRYLSNAIYLLIITMHMFLIINTRIERLLI